MRVFVLGAALLLTGFGSAALAPPPDCPVQRLELAGVAGHRLDVMAERIVFHTSDPKIVPASLDLQEEGLGTLRAVDRRAKPTGLQTTTAARPKSWSATGVSRWSIL